MARNTTSVRNPERDQRRSPPARATDSYLFMRVLLVGFVNS